MRILSSLILLLLVVSAVVAQEAPPTPPPADPAPAPAVPKLTRMKLGEFWYGMYLPDGRHTLEIQSEWGPASRKQKFASGEIPGAAGVKTWHVPLLPCSGYWLTLRADRSEEPIQWELTSNHSSFERKQETLPLEGFQYRGSSYSVDSTVQFPNQVKAFLAKDLEQASRTLEGVRLMSTTFNGSVGDENYAVKTTVRLRSEGPACISASDALRAFILKSDEYLLPYEGDGKYVIRRAQPGDDVMKQVD